MADSCSECALVEYGENVGTTVLMRAAQNGHVECVNSVIEAGADVNATDETPPSWVTWMLGIDGGNTALMEAAKLGNGGCLEILIKAGAYVNVKNSDGKTALFLATENGHFNCVDLLLNSGADVNVTCSQAKDTALSIAAKNGHVKCVERLLNAGAGVNTSTIFDYISTSSDKRSNMSESENYLNLLDKSFSFAVVAAATYGHNDCLQLLLRNVGSDIKLDIDMLFDAVIKTASAGHNKCLQLLMEVDLTDNENHTAKLDVTLGKALIKAAEEGHTECVRVLIQSGACVNSRGAFSCEEEHRQFESKEALGTILQCAQLIFSPAMGSNTATYDVPVPTFSFSEYVESLQKTVPDFWCEQRNSGATALIAASRSASASCVELLLEAGADVNAGNRNGGNTPLIAAAYWGFLQQVGKNNSHLSESTTENGLNSIPNMTKRCVQLPVQAGADVNATNDFGFTALIAAAAFSNFHCLKAILEAGADVNFTTHFGDTALICAAGCNTLACIQLLLKAGAYVNKVSKSGTNALQRHLVVHAALRDTAERRTINLVLYAAGEKLPNCNEWRHITTFPETTTFPDYLSQLAEPTLCLMDICRRAIRTYLLELNAPHTLNLFCQVPHLGLPSIVTEYLVYNVSLDEEIDGQNTEINNPVILCQNLQFSMSQVSAELLKLQQYGRRGWYTYNNMRTTELQTTLGIEDSDVKEDDVDDDDSYAYTSPSEREDSDEKSVTDTSNSDTSSSADDNDYSDEGSVDEETSDFEWCVRHKSETVVTH